MKQRIRIFSFLLMICVLLNIFCIPVYAMGDVAIIGNYKNKLTLIADKEYFSSQYLVGPGDYWSAVIEIKNDKNSEESIDVRLASVTSNIDDTTLFDKMDLKIIVGNKTLYDGPYNGNPTTDYFTIKPNKSVELIIVMGVPDTVGNECQDKVMDSMWLFETRADERYDPPVDDDDYVRYYEYTVEYEDSDGNKLHEDKVGKAPYGNTLTEYPIDIDGYTPRDNKLSIKITRNGDKNVITFIYDKNPEPVQPPEDDKPEDKPDDTKPDDKPEDKPVVTPPVIDDDDNDSVTTGNDREVAPFIFGIVGSCMVLFFLILFKKKKKDNEKNQDKNKK